MRDLAADRAFYERLGLTVIWEGPEYPAGLRNRDGARGIQKVAPITTRRACSPGRSASPTSTPPWSDACSAGISFELEHNNPAGGWSYRRAAHPHPERLPAGTRRPQRM